MTDLPAYRPGEPNPELATEIAIQRYEGMRRGNRDERRKSAKEHRWYRVILELTDAEWEDMKARWRADPSGFPYHDPPFSEQP